MVRRMNLSRLKEHSNASLRKLENQLGFLTSGWSKDYGLQQEKDAEEWIVRMAVIDLHSVWERFAEDRLAVGLNHHPIYFLERNEVRGISHISKGLAYYLVRGGLRYFDFRSMAELLRKGDDLLSRDLNPFRHILPELRNSLDILAVLRNYVVHGSAASELAYKKTIMKNYRFSATPQIQDFLGRLDRRPKSRARNRPYIVGFFRVVGSAIDAT